VHPRFLLPLSAWTLAVGLSLSPARAEKGNVMVDKVEYHGWKNNLRLSNGDAELIITLDVGPRIISYRLADGKNVLKNYEEQLGKTGEKDWQIRGGHRLWVGPEDLTRTYAPDNGPVGYKEQPGGVRLTPVPQSGGGIRNLPSLEQPGGVRLTPAPDKAYGIQREMIVQLEPRGSRVTILHLINNVGPSATELAPWALTVMAPGGVEIIPLPPKRPHPGPPQNARSPKDYAANQLMSIWPFFDFKDPRWSFGSKYITLRQDAKKGPTKIGLAHQLGWVGYLNNGVLFVKRFGYDEGKTYPDNGVNFETFTNEDMLEIESLGPLTKVAPGKVVEHTEHWELIGNVQSFDDETGIDRNVRSKLPQK
jgi:hypothetical protein